MVGWVIGSGKQVAWRSTPVVICHVIGTKSEIPGQDGRISRRS